MRATKSQLPKKYIKLKKKQDNEILLNQAVLIGVL